MTALVARLRAALPRPGRLAMTAGAIFAVIVFLWIPELFWLAVVVGLVGWLIVVHDQRDEATAETADLLFKLAAAEQVAQLAEADRDAVVMRLAEILDEHAACPVPVEVAL